MTKTSTVLRFLDALNVAPPRDKESETPVQQRRETRALALRQSLRPPIPAPVVPYEDLAQELPRPETSPINGKQNQGKTKLPLAKSSLAPHSPKSWPPPLTPRPYQTSTPPTMSKSAQAMKRPWQEMGSGNRQSSKPHNSDLAMDASVRRLLSNF